MTDDILSATIRRNPPRTQEEGCRLAARQSIAALGPVYEDRDIVAAALGLASGLFGDAFDEASSVQRYIWVRMCETAYRASLPKGPVT